LSDQYAVFRFLEQLVDFAKRHPSETTVMVLLAMVVGEATYELIVLIINRNKSEEDKDGSPKE
jgi:hypothetical protein